MCCAGEPGAIGCNVVPTPDKVRFYGIKPVSKYKKSIGKQYREQVRRRRYR